MFRECVPACVSVFAPDGTSEEILDERSDQLHPQLDVAVRPLKRGAGHLSGALVQHLLLLSGRECETQVCIIQSYTVIHHFWLRLKKKKKKSRPPAAGSATPHSLLLWRFGPPGHGELSGNQN